MTRQEIMDMPADRELDKLVAERCLKLEVFGSANSAVGDYYSPQINIRGRAEIPFYSTDLNAAWDALAKRYNLMIKCYGDGLEITVYADENPYSPLLTDAPIAAAICKACLLAELGL